MIDFTSPLQDWMNLRREESERAHEGDEPQNVTRFGDRLRILTTGGASISNMNCKIMDDALKEKQTYNYTDTSKPTLSLDRSGLTKLFWLVW